jgi:hypothetical protein
MVILYFMLAVLPDLRTAVPFLVLTSAAIAVLLAMLQTVTDRYGGNISPAMILGVAALIRFMFVFRLPELSDDIYRYLWDGLQMVLGNNPYALAPAVVLPQNPEAAEILASVNQPELVTIYPPGAQMVFLWAAVLSRRVWGFKCLLTLMDIGSCAMIIRLLLRYEMPAVRSILYAWHPLVVLEISGSGHIDAAGIFFFFLSLLTTATGLCSPSSHFKSKNRFTVILSGAFYAWSCLIKLFPVLFFPLLLKHTARRNRPLFLAGSLAGGLLLSLPFLPHLKNMCATLFQYARHWEFSGLSFFCLRRLGISGDLTRWILITVFLIAASAIWMKAPGNLSPSGRRNTPAGFFYPLYGINLAFLFLSPTLHPWYALYLTSTLPFVGEPAGFILSWSVLLAYSVLIPYALTGQWAENHLATILIWLGPAAAFLVARIIARIFPAVLKPDRRRMLP